ncbi:cytochrome C oxidase subunit IV family protein [Mycolicibacterium cosmeticum]|uniref:cytochrome C oxidase subunit IV family protein n=1 Tax=Mycolicibacterium cosmeticum TaxID=258533 RepID=UPI000B0480F0|nr:cytochrome C oxidase subunit IV family protein [Mycolicibacterium cosmeticum]
MTVLSYLRNPLTTVWAVLTAVTLASWLTARDGGAAHRLNAPITVIVLTMAMVKAFLVIWHFMEVRHAPTWLRATMVGWLVGLFASLLGVYFAAA